MNDLRHALRRLLSTPGFTIAAVITLALGIGANTLVFSAVRGLLLRPLPFAGGDRIVWVHAQNRQLGVLGDNLGWDEANAVAGMRSFDAVAVIGGRNFIREEGDRRIDWRGLRVTATLFDVLGVTPALGERFSASHMNKQPAPAMMLAYERWEKDFGSDPSILGRIIHFADKKSFTVIGILPRGLEFPVGRAPATGSGSGYAVGVQDFWVLAQDRPGEYPDGALLARLAPGATVQTAQTEADALRPASAQAQPGRSFALVLLRDHALGILRPALPLLQAVSALVLLIACANLANLVLARTAGARREFAVRIALGADRVDLFRILLAESLILTVSGATLGLAVASIGRRLFGAAASGQVAFIERIQVDGAVLLFTLGLLVATTMVFALLPLTVGSAATAQPMFGRTQTAGPRGTRALRSLAAVQVAVTLVLLTGAALVLQSLSRLLAVDTGYQPAKVIAADVLLFEPPSVFVPYFRQLHQRLRSLPGVEAVGLIQSTPLTGKWTFREPMIVVGRAPDATSTVPVAGSFVAFDYFEAMGIPLLAGRVFTESEFLSPKLPTIVINDVAARLLFPNEAAIGKRVEMFGRPREIVGVVKATRDVRLETAAEAQWYQPAFVGGSQLLVRTSGDPAAFAATLRQELLASDPRLIVRRVEPLTDIVDASVFERRLAGQLLTVFAAVALSLALVGLYGVLNFSTIQRRREFGIRGALGARRQDVIALVLREGLAVTTLGIGIGVLVSIAGTRTLESLLFEVSATNPWTILGASVGLTAAAIVACAAPAWRAASVDPSIVLRAE